MTCLTFCIFLGKTHWGGMGPFPVYEPYCARTKPAACLRRSRAHETAGERGAFPGR